MVLLLAVLLATGASAQSTWTGLAANDNWTTTGNWDPDTAYPSTTGHDAVFDDTATGMVDVDDDINIRYLYVRPTGGATNIYEIADGKTFEPRYLQASRVNVTNNAIIRGGTFRPYSEMEVARKHLETVFPQASLQLTNTVFDVANLTALLIGLNGHHIRESFGVFDASHAQIRFGDHLNSFTVPTLSIGQNRGLGHLFLPSAVTNINVTALYLGSWHHIGSWPEIDRLSFVDLGDQPQLDALKIKTLAQVGKGNFQYRDANGDPQPGLPPNLDLQIGEPGNPAVFRLGYMYNIPNTDVRWGRFRRFEGHFSELTIAHCANSQYVYAELDLGSTNTLELAGDVTADAVDTPYLKLGGIRTGATGVLKLPGTVTNLTFDTFIIGEFNDLTGPPNYSILHFGSNAQARAFTVLDIFRQGLGQFQYVDAGGTPRAGFPDGLDFRVGTPGRRAEFLVGAANGINTVVELGAGIERFEAWLSSFTVSKRNNSWLNHYVTSTLDLRGADVVALDVEGDANIGHHVGALSTVHLPRCTMRCANLMVGREGSGTTSYDNNWFGHLFLSNAVVVVTNQTTVGQTGRIYATLDGYSSGIDLGTDNLTVAEPHPTTGIFGKIDLSFASNPLMPLDDYFGLRMQGDAVAFLQGLTNATPQRLTWNIDGLSPRYQERFGIHYNETRDMTIVGIERMLRGSLIMIK